MTEETINPPPIEPVSFDDNYIDHPFIPSRRHEDVTAFLEAFAQAQSEFEPVVRNRTVTIKPREAAAYSFTYAELANVLAATKALHAHGISVSQPLHEDRQGVTWLYTIVAHKSGAGQVTRLKLHGAADIKAFGAETTYLRRYSYAPAIGVASEDDVDEDGRGGGEPPARGGYDDPPASQRSAKPTPQRKATAAAQPASKAAETVAKPTTGAVKNLLGKIEALKLPPEDVTAMLAELEVPEDSANWSMADWTKVRAEVDRRMAG